MGKTKNYVSNGDGTGTMHFKDDACGEDGVFNPGANQIGLTIDGLGRACMLLSQHFFSILDDRCRSADSHYLDCNVDEGYMMVEELTMFPIEFVWRSVSWGSFCDRYGIQKGLKLEEEGIIETTLKSDDLGDPLIVEAAIVALNLMSKDDLYKCNVIMMDVSRILTEELSHFGYTLIDFKMEFGLNADGIIMIGDEVSGSIWRITDEHGTVIDPIDAARTICAEYYVDEN